MGTSQSNNPLAGTIEESATTTNSNDDNLVSSSVVEDSSDQALFRTCHSSNSDYGEMDLPNDSQLSSSCRDNMAVEFLTGEAQQQLQQQHQSQACNDTSATIEALMFFNHTDMADNDGSSESYDITSDIEGSLQRQNHGHHDYCRRQYSHEPMKKYDQHDDVASSINKKAKKRRGNIVLSLLSREVTGGFKASSPSYKHGSNRRKNIGRHSRFHQQTSDTSHVNKDVPPIIRLKNKIGGCKGLYERHINKPSGGMTSEVEELYNAAVVQGNWTATQIIISRIAPRLIGDPSVSHHTNDNETNNNSNNNSGNSNSAARNSDGSTRQQYSPSPWASQRRRNNDPSLPPYVWTSRLQYEREVFVQSGGVDLFIRIIKDTLSMFDSINEQNPLNHDDDDDDDDDYSNNCTDLWPDDDHIILLCDDDQSACPHDDDVDAPHLFNYDARDLSKSLVSNVLAGCYNEILASLRELAYSMPNLIENGIILGNDRCSNGQSYHNLYGSSSTTQPSSVSCYFDYGAFLPFLFTLLSHDACFDCAAALIEEILSFQSAQLSPLPTTTTAKAASIRDPDRLNTSEEPNDNDDILPMSATVEAAVNEFYHKTVLSVGYYNTSSSTVLSPATSTFFLGNVPDLYDLWERFNCRQLAHFCRILALLVFEPEDRQLLENPSVLRSLELLQLRRDRAARARCDPTVDRNQSIVISDGRLMKRLLSLLRVMNYAPALRRKTSHHTIAHFPYIADTLLMLGLSEISRWAEVDELEKLARKNLPVVTNDSSDGASLSLSDLGSVSDMLESLNGIMHHGNSMEASTQLRHIIQVINAATEHGILAGLNGINNRRGNRPFMPSSTSVDHSSEQTVGSDERAIGRIRTPEDAANELQFNALLLSPYQVEVLFVLCTLLGGRRKIDVQQMMESFGLIDVLDEMFHRLSWGSSTDDEPSEISRHANNGNIQSSASSSAGNTNNNSDGAEAQQTGMHGAECDCNPESALRVQYLRLLHNFCDRDCDNHQPRRLLLSPSEAEYIFSPPAFGARNLVTVGRSHLKPGLLSKVLNAFIEEPDDSPYRFWLASCVESYLRGSSRREQLFAAQGGLLAHLISDITSDRLHCAGSLQTVFDLLGELCKGNEGVLQLLVQDLDEDGFRKLMTCATNNLVDSNVFIRSVVLTIERIAAERGVKELHRPVQIDRANSKPYHWVGKSGSASRAYLTHSWWDSAPPKLQRIETKNPMLDELFRNVDESRPSDWFPSNLNVKNADVAVEEIESRYREGDSYLYDNESYHGWLFSPTELSKGPITPESFSPNTIDRLSWFFSNNETKLLRDLLREVNLQNINHENICCLNTAVIITIFAYRRQKLPHLLDDLRRKNEGRKKQHKWNLNQLLPHTSTLKTDRSIDDEELVAVEAIKSLSITDRDFRINEDDNVTSATTKSMQQQYHQTSSTTSTDDEEASIAPVTAAEAAATTTTEFTTDLLQNFRELLWFWEEYYTHRGRDRLSLEFSSHLRFHEWKNVVCLLTKDDDSPTSLVNKRVQLPRSPYSRSPRINDNGLPRGH